MICSTCAYAPQCIGKAVNNECIYYRKATEQEQSEIVKILLERIPF
jgi:hypothetical protein